MVFILSIIRKCWHPRFKFCNIILGSIVTSFDVQSFSDTAVDGMLEAIAAEVKDQKTFTFDGKSIVYEKNSMSVDSKPYGSVEQAVSNIYL